MIFCEFFFLNDMVAQLFEKINDFPTKFGHESTVISTYGANMGETKGFFMKNWKNSKKKQCKT